MTEVGLKEKNATNRAIPATPDGGTRFNKI